MLRFAQHDDGRIGGKWPRVIVAVVAVGLACGAWGGVARAGGDEAELPVVRVDCGEDLGEVNRLWRDFGQGGESADPEYLAPVVEKMRALEPRMVRVDHLLDYYVKVTSREPIAADFSALHRVVDLVEAMGAQPLLCVSYVPRELAGGRRVIDPPDMEAWAAVVRLLVREMAGRARPVRYYEVWNEPNLDSFWGGTRDEFLDLYAVTSRAIRAEAPEAQIGGAGFADYGRAWIEALLDRVARDNLPFDFLSWHKYATPSEVVRAQVFEAQDLCRQRGLDVELILDEWNYDAGLAAGNDDHRGAVYIAEQLAHLVDTPLAYAPFFEIKDGDESAEEFWGRWGLITHRHTPKASAFAMFAHGRLGARRVALTSEAEDVGGLATLQGDDVMFTLYNASREGRWVRVELANMSAEGAGTWRRWLIDACHSNPALGAPATLQLVEDEFPVVSGGQGSGVPRGGDSFSRAVFLTPMSVSLCSYVVANERPGPIACEVDVLPADGTWRRRAVVRVRNQHDETLEVGPIRLWDDSNGRVQISDRGHMRDKQRFTIAAGAVLEVPYEVELYPSAVSHLYSVRASMKVGRNPEIRASTVVVLPATLVIELAPARVPWPAEAASLPVSLRLANQSGAGLNGELAWRNDAALQVQGDLPAAYELAVSERRELELGLSTGGRPRDRVAPAEMVVEATLAGGREGNRTVASRVRLVPSFVVPRLRSEIKVDGMLDDWSGIPVLSEVPRPGEAGAGNPMRMAWNDGGLFVALEVEDAHHHQPYGDGRMWQGDSVQFAFDTEWEDRAGAAYDASIVEMGFALSPDGPVAWIYEALGDGELNRRLDVPVAIGRADGHTVYEIRLPWLVFEERRPPFGVSAVLNDVDGDGAMRQWSEWGGGVAGRKDPGKFLHLSTEGEVGG